MKRTAYSLTVLMVLAVMLSTILLIEPTRVATEPASAEDGLMISTGPEQRIIGPSHNIDSLYATVRDSHGLHAYMSNGRTIWYHQRPDGTLTNARTVLTSGPRGSVDQCGVHPVGAVYKVTSTHWVTFYHGERANPNEFDGACAGGTGRRNHTRWSVLRLETFDAGKTWHKGEQVLRQDQDFMAWSTENPAARRDDAGSPRLVVRDDYLYLFYRAVNHDSQNTQRMSVARAPKSSLGKPGSWQKYYNGEFAEPGLGGHQSTIPGLNATARGISWNTYLNAYIAVRAWVGGIVLYESDRTDLTSWRELKQVVGPFGTESAWGKPCIPGETPDFPVAIGYGALIGWGGSSTTTGRNFWVYYMKKPQGNCFSSRFLVRRQVALDSELLVDPTPSLNSGEPERTTTYTTRFSRLNKVAHRHGWIVSARLSRNDQSWGGRTVRVQKVQGSVWKTVKRLETGPRGYVRLYGYGRGRYRFHVVAWREYPAAHTVTFRRPRH